MARGSVNVVSDKSKAPIDSPTFTGTVSGVTQTMVGGTETILKSASYTLALTDNYKINKCVSASTITVTIPLNSAVAFPVNSEIVISRYGAGAVTLSPTSGVTLYSSDSKKSINKQYEFLTLKKIATDEWVLFGSLA